MQNKALEQVGKEGFAVITELNKNMKTLESHMIVLADNQIEFGKYLEDIQTRLKKLNNEGSD